MDIQETKYSVKMGNGGSISLHRFMPPKVAGDPIVIAHGTISNGDAVRDLAVYLAGLGYDCWSLEWGGHGKSRAAHKRQDFEYPAFNDLPTAIEFVIGMARKLKLLWVSHSGGGHLPLMYLARYPKQQNRFTGLVTIGAQATDGAMGIRYKLRAAALWAVTTLLGQTPKALVSMGSEGEPTCLLAQWSVWNLRGQWLGKDRFDYLAGLDSIDIPALIMAGGNDSIAPVSGCQKVFNALGSQDKSWKVFSKEQGFSKNFTHGQLIRGKAARAEVFPMVGDWISQRYYL